VTISRTLSTLAAAALITAGCGGSNGSNITSSGAPTTPSDTAAPAFTDQQTPPARLVIEVTIKNKAVTPTNAALQSKVGEPIVIKVNSDVADQLHVHSDPEHTFNIEPNKNLSFQFTVSVPGKVDVELNQLNKTVATITVQ
jgi:ABC-type glycerol-3-phosphate transport system substrate-binding protein